MAKRRNYKTSVKKKPVQTTQLVNRKYKDTVFRMLFSDRKNLLSLYNAINGSRYTDPEELEIVTLENAIYMGMKNDLAFIIDTGLFLYEHQSTYNPNMPLRDLLYISAESLPLTLSYFIMGQKRRKNGGRIICQNPTRPGWVIQTWN